MTENTCYTKLPNRGLIHIEGADRHDFLQRIISNDMNALKTDKMLYACLLTPQGKFLHDFFVIDGDEFILLDCEGGQRAQDLYKRLNMYRLRADVQISVEENVQVYAILNSNIPTFQHSNIHYPDPRHSDMGYRSFEKPEGIEEKPFKTWDERRIRLCIPDGSRDMIPEKSTMDEGRIDTLSGVSYDKGCYVGQEPTARMHYRGLGKKHLETVQLNAIPEKAQLRSSCGDIGIALVRK